MNCNQEKRLLAWIDKNHDALAHFAKGGAVQVTYHIRPIGHNAQWNDTDEVFPMSYRDREYRVKPQPKVIYAFFDAAGEYKWSAADEEERDRMAGRYPHMTIVKMVEEVQE
jgi:hypothetical protein